MGTTWTSLIPASILSARDILGPPGIALLYTEVDFPFIFALQSGSAVPDNRYYRSLLNWSRPGSFRSIRI